MYEGPGDVFVIPCSMCGTDTWFVRQRLGPFEIPSPPSQLILGDIDVIEMPAAQNIARAAAFAASVKGKNGSDLAAIHGIGKHLGLLRRVTRLGPLHRKPCSEPALVASHFWAVVARRRVDGHHPRIALRPYP